MSGAAKWTADETVDLALPWEDFTAAHPTRTWDAYRLRRGTLGMGYTPKPDDVQDCNRRRRRRVASVLHTPAPAPPKKPAPTPADPEDLLDRPTAAALLRLRNEQLVDALLAFQDAHQERFPPPGDISVRVPVTDGGPIGVALMSDWHVGSMGTDHRRILRDVEQIAAHPRLYCGLGGDNIDNFILSKMVDAARGQVMASIEAQWLLFETMLLPLLESGSLLWVSSGNHDQWTRKCAGIDGVLAALSQIPVADDQWNPVSRYTGEGGFIDLHLGPDGGPEQVYTVWRKHRPSRFTSSFNATHFLKQMTRLQLPREPDILISEHLHTPETGNWWYKGRKKLLVNCGSYKVVDQWARDGNYLDGGYGVPVAVLWPTKHRMLIFDSIDEALELLDGVRTPLSA